MIDTLTQLDRIRTTPIPMTYASHLRDTLTIYLLSLPFQLIGSMFWYSIPIVFFTSFMMVGLDGIATQIENPFGYDPNDLPMDLFCKDIQKGILAVLKMKRE